MLGLGVDGTLAVSALGGFGLELRGISGVFRGFGASRLGSASDQQEKA